MSHESTFASHGSRSTLGLSLSVCASVCVSICASLSSSICVVGVSSAQEREVYLDLPKDKPLPPFLAQMQKHPVSIQVSVKESALDSGRPAEAGLKVGLVILARSPRGEFQKVSQYTKVTDEAGRVLIDAVPSNPSVQSMIFYEAWVEREGIRFPFQLKGVPASSQPNAQGQAEAVLTELNLTVYPHKESLWFKHNYIDLQIDEDALLARHSMTLHNDSNQMIDVAQLFPGGLKIPAPDGAKAPGLHSTEREDLQVKGAALYYTGVLLPKSETRINWYYTIPHRAQEFVWHQTLPLPTEVGDIFTSTERMPNHQAKFVLELEPPKHGGRVVKGTTRSGAVKILDKLPDLKAYEPLNFTIKNIPAPSRAPRHVMFALIAAIALGLFAFALFGPSGESKISRSQLLIERDQLLKALEALERLIKRNAISKPRYQREREAITARLVTIYRALERMDGEPSDEPAS